MQVARRDVECAISDPAGPLPACRDLHRVVVARGFG